MTSYCLHLALQWVAILESWVPMISDLFHVELWAKIHTEKVCPYLDLTEKEKQVQADDKLTRCLLISKQDSAHFRVGSMQRKFTSRDGGLPSFADSHAIFFRGFWDQEEFSVRRKREVSFGGANLPWMLWESFWIEWLHDNLYFCPTVRGNINICCPPQNGWKWWTSNGECNHNTSLLRLHHFSFSSLPLKTGLWGKVFYLGKLIAIPSCSLIGTHLKWILPRWW